MSEEGYAQADSKLRSALDDYITESKSIDSGDAQIISDVMDMLYDLDVKEKGDLVGP